MTNLEIYKNDHTAEIKPKSASEQTIEIKIGKERICQLCGQFDGAGSWKTRPWLSEELYVCRRCLDVGAIA